MAISHFHINEISDSKLHNWFSNECMYNRLIIFFSLPLSYLKTFSQHFDVIWQYSAMFTQNYITSDSMMCNLRIFYLLDKWEGSDLFNRPSWKFIYSEKATKFCEIFTSLLSYVVPVKSKVKVLQTFVAFSEHEL